MIHRIIRVSIPELYHLLYGTSASKTSALWHEQYKQSAIYVQRNELNHVSRAKKIDIPFHLRQESQSLSRLVV